METIEKNLTASCQKLSKGENQDLEGNKDVTTSSIQGITECVDFTIEQPNMNEKLNSSSNIKEVNLITARSIELQNVLERQSKELAETRHRMGDMQNK